MIASSFLITFVFLFTTLQVTNSSYIKCESQTNEQNTFFSFSEFQPMRTYCWPEEKLCKRFSVLWLNAIISEDSANIFFKKKVFGRASGKFMRVENIENGNGLFYQENEPNEEIALRCGNLLCISGENITQL